MKNNRYEMILCVVNAGFSDLVMDAAKAAGARGGTILRARGSANQDAETFFGITIQHEKDVVMIVVPLDLRDRILKAIYEEAGLASNGQGIAFSIPVDKAVGLSEAQTE